MQKVDRKEGFVCLLFAWFNIAMLIVLSLTAIEVLSHERHRAFFVPFLLVLYPPVFVGSMWFILARVRDARRHFGYSD